MQLMVQYNVTNSISGENGFPNLTARLGQASERKGGKIGSVPLQLHANTTTYFCVCLCVCVATCNHNHRVTAWGRSRRTCLTLRRPATPRHRRLLSMCHCLPCGSRGWYHSFFWPPLQCSCIPCMKMIALPTQMKRFAFSLNISAGSPSNLSGKTLSLALPSAREKKKISLSLSPKTFTFIITIDQCACMK